MRLLLKFAKGSLSLVKPGCSQACSSSNWETILAKVSNKQAEPMQRARRRKPASLSLILNSITIYLCGKADTSVA